MGNHKRLLEAALFMASGPLGLNELARITGLGSVGNVKERLEELKADYAERGMVIVEGPNGWEMLVRNELLPRVAHLTPYADMSEGCKRTLALVAYKEPLLQSEVIKTQGNKAYTYIKQLIKMGLLKAEKEGRTKALSLTKEFENYFGEERERVKEHMERQLEAMPKKKVPEEPAPEGTDGNDAGEEAEEPEPSDSLPKKDIKEQLKEMSDIMGLKEEKPKKKPDWEID